MQAPIQSRLIVLLVTLFCFNGWVGRASGDDRASRPTPAPQEAFSPSNARTEHGGLIPVEQFFSATRCLACHQDTHAAWSESLHRNAARDPFYRESVDILLRSRGIEFTRHCESCHTPVALLSGALAKNNPRQQAPFTPLDDEGVTCTVCHSITEARLDGSGSFTIRRPALLAKEDGTPLFDNFTDAQILADVPAHKRAVMREQLRQPEFCATCHKVDAPPELNGYKHIRGFSAYDEWQQSGASHETVSPYYKTEKRMSCCSCHMPKIASLNDRAAKDGVIASHQWLGANTAAPLFFGQTKQVARIEEFLRRQVITADIFALQRESTGETLPELTARNWLVLKPGEAVTAEVVIANRKAAHSFAPEVRDLYEIWVAFEAVTDNGEVLLRSGYVEPDALLDESAHVYKAILLDADARPITRHQIWLTNVVGYNNAIPAGRSDIARFRFRVPANWNTRPASSISLKVAVNYRRFNQEFTNYVLRRQGRVLTVPTVRMAEAKVRISSGDRTNSAGKDSHSANNFQNPDSSARRWNDYGIALLEQAQYGSAGQAFRRASLLNPQDLNPLISAAVAEMRTERFGPDRNQLHKAAALLDAALKLDPVHARARYFHALVLRSQDNPTDAAAELAKLAQEYPRDREVWRQLGQTLYALGRLAEARQAFEAVARIDPTDFGAYQFLSPIYQSEGQADQATYARNLYLQWRDDPLAGPIAARFFAAHPQWADERVLAHTHDEDSPLRPVLSGFQAAPEK